MKRSVGTLCAVAILSALLLLPVTASAQQETAAASPPSTASAQPEAAVPSPPPEGLVHSVIEGDTLWDLAAKHLGTPWKWTEIWERNRFVTNPHYIYPGNRIVIFPPGATEVAIQEEPMPASMPSAAEAVPLAEPSPAAAPVVAIPIKPVPREPYLDITPAEFVRGGEFLREMPRGIGKIWGGREPKLGFSENDV